MEEITLETQVLLNKIYRDFFLTLRSSWFKKHKNSDLLEFCCRLTDWLENFPSELIIEELEWNLNGYIATVESNLEFFQSLPLEVEITYTKQIIEIKKFMGGKFKK